MPPEFKAEKSYVVSENRDSWVYTSFTALFPNKDGEEWKKDGNSEHRSNVEDNQKG